MTGFTPKQITALRRKLDRDHVHSKEVNGRPIDYIEGWFAMAEANAIFGFDGWDREMTHFERLYERARNERISCGYIARVRIRVRAGEGHIIREGTGWGNATAPILAEAHERALKGAETDATKRALATFGNRFGLALYDKEQNGVTKKPDRSGFYLHAPDGIVLAENLSAEGFCSGLRQLIEKVQTSEVQHLIPLNKESLLRLRIDARDLRTAKGIHYADVLERLAKERIESSGTPEVNPQSSSLISPPKPSKISHGYRIDKSELAIGEERRFRDKAHLDFVASHSCLICGRQPAHAHHVTFAQRRGLSLKVSDEFTVPLCAVHHDELHRKGTEVTWWKDKEINPLPIAMELWTSSRQRNSYPAASGDVIVEDAHGASEATACLKRCSAI